MTLSRVPFSDVVRDVSAGNVKIAQSDFLSSGRLAVVDQGKSLVAGFTDEVGAAVRTAGPLIVFGDHTRALKFVDFPFAMGADGTKVLQVRDGIHPRYVYWYLHSLQIPSAGYSRHFKFLKEVTVPVPSMGDQRRIAAILDHADALRAKRRQVLAHLDALTQSIFHDMFTGTEKPVALGEVSKIQGGLQVSHRRADLPLKVPYLRVANAHRGRLDLSEVKLIRATAAEAQRTKLVSGDLLFVEGHANPLEVGRVALWSGEVEDCVHQNHLIRARLDKSRVLPAFAAVWFNTPVGASHFRRAGRTTSGLNTISSSTVRAAPLPVPAMDEQRKFVDRIERASASALLTQKGLALGDELFASLQSRAFKGEL